MLIFGQTAAGILGGNDPSETLVAAAEFGKGRVIVLTHNDYLTGFPFTHSDPSVNILHEGML